MTSVRKMSTAMCELVTKANAFSLVNSFDTVLTDCDGVLWNDNDTIPGAVETIHKLKSKGKRVFYVTNNSTRTREQYMQKCQNMGFPADIESIISSGYVTAHYIKEKLKYTGKVFMIGSEGLKQELDNAGIPNIGVGPEPEVIHGFDDLRKMQMDPEIKCVVVGFDKYFNYTKVARALTYLQQPGCHFIGTNIDSGLPMGEGKFMPGNASFITCGQDGRREGFTPGTGSIIACVEMAASRKATIMGKPDKPIADVAMTMHNLDPARTIMIGDRLNTDIALGYYGGFRSLMVLTGFSTLAEAQSYQNSSVESEQAQVPNYYIPSLGQLGEILNDLDK